MGAVYGFAAGCVCAIVAQRTEAEEPRHDEKDAAVDRAIRVAVAAADTWTAGPGFEPESRPHLTANLTETREHHARGCSPWISRPSLALTSVQNRQVGQGAVRAVTSPLSVWIGDRAGAGGVDGDLLVRRCRCRSTCRRRRPRRRRGRRPRPTVVGRRHHRRRRRRRTPASRARCRCRRRRSPTPGRRLDAAVVRRQPQRRRSVRGPRSSRCRCRRRRRRSSPLTSTDPSSACDHDGERPGHRDLVVDAAPVGAEVRARAVQLEHVADDLLALARRAQTVADLGPHLDGVAVGRHDRAPSPPSCCTSIAVSAGGRERRRLDALLVGEQRRRRCRSPTTSPATTSTAANTFHSTRTPAGVRRRRRRTAAARRRRLRRTARRALHHVRHRQPRTHRRTASTRR